ncbi:MAG: hypothetical protein R2932_12835 [Caldilineaceae bacterium]
MTTLRNALYPLHRRLGASQFSRMIGMLILAATLSLGALATLLVLRPSAPESLLSGQQLAWAMVAAINNDPSVQISTGTYLPGDALILYARVTTAESNQIHAWARHQLEPFTARLSQLPAKEQFTWVIDLVPSRSSNVELIQEVLTVPLGQIAEPLRYQYIRNLPTLALPVGHDPTPNKQLLLGNLATSALSTTVAAEMIAIPLQATQPVPSPSAASGREKLVLGEPAPQTFVDVPTTLRSLTFEPVVDGSSAVADEWQLISGRWVAEDGMYRQLEVDGSDYISLLNLPKQRHYSMEVRLRMNGGEMGGGIIYHAPTLDSRAGAHVIDMDERGRYLRWGYYNEEGRYTLEGGVPLATGLADGQWHRLRLLTHGDVSTIWFDDQELSRQENHSAEGYLGLVTSRSQIDFDDLVVMALPATTDVAPDKIGAPSVIPIVAAAVADLVETEAIFYDDFAEDNRKSWQVLDGTWQFLDGVYLQTDLDGLERGTVSTFQGNNYRFTVSMRLIDGSMGAGLYFNMAQRGRKTQSQLIRFQR